MRKNLAELIHNLDTVDKKDSEIKLDYPVVIESNNIMQTWRLKRYLNKHEIPYYTKRYFVNDYFNILFQKMTVENLIKNLKDISKFLGED